MVLDAASLKDTLLGLENLVKTQHRVVQELDAIVATKEFPEDNGNVGQSHLRNTLHTLHYLEAEFRGLQTDVGKTEQDVR